MNADGTTFTGDYSKLTAEQLKTMKIGPGVAPDAEIYAFRVSVAAAAPTSLSRRSTVPSTPTVTATSPTE